MVHLAVASAFLTRALVLAGVHLFGPEVVYGDVSVCARAEMSLIFQPQDAGGMPHASLSATSLQSSSRSMPPNVVLLGSCLRAA